MQGSGLSVEDLKFRVQGSGFSVSMGLGGLGFGLRAAPVALLQSNHFSPSSQSPACRRLLCGSLSPLNHCNLQTL